MLSSCEASPGLKPVCGLRRADVSQSASVHQVPDVAIDTESIYLLLINALNGLFANVALWLINSQLSI